MLPHNVCSNTCSKSSLVFFLIHELDAVHLDYFILVNFAYAHIFRGERRLALHPHIFRGETRLALHLLKLQKHIWEAEHQILMIGQYCIIMMLHQHHSFQHLPLSHQHVGLVPWYKINAIIQPHRVKEADLACIIFPEPLILELSFQNRSPRHVKWLFLVLNCKLLIPLTLFRW